MQTDNYHDTEVACSKDDALDVCNLLYCVTEPLDNQYSGTLLYIKDDLGASYFYYYLLLLLILLTGPLV